MADLPIPTLVSHLRDKYTKHLQTLHKQTKNAKLNAKQRAEADKQLQLDKTFYGFTEFCENYLSTVNPAVQTWFAGEGVGLILADQTRVVLAQSSIPALSGTTTNMQEDSSVAITKGEGLGTGRLPV